MLFHADGPRQAGQQENEQGGRPAQGYEPDGGDVPEYEDALNIF